MRKPVLIPTIVVLVILALGAASPAGAAGRHRVDLTGFGMYTIDVEGTATATGTASGEPFDGTFVATLSATDGSLPDPGVCEFATVTLRLNGEKGRLIQLASADQACGKWVDVTYVVTQVFTGRYLVTDSSRRQLAGTEGFYEIRLTVDGRASVFAIDT